MKYILLLALFFSCSTKKMKTTPTSNSTDQTNAGPVSPYTVKPCYCMKIFEPVCAGGQNYGNSCEAECHGHKTWTEGACKISPKK
jgi:hypothetical protein